MEFRILGPLEVLDDGRPLSIRRGKEQALLVYLLLHANEVIPSRRLIDELWGERPPATAAKILQNAVSHLRKQLGEGRLATRDPGYVFHLEDDELDLRRFERLAREGRGEEALALWRGPPLVDLQEERFADEARRRLEEQRLVVLEDRIDADLAAGHHGGLVPELEELVAKHPLRERLHGQLMLALYRAGRQADALEVYRRARRTLDEELGLEPGPALQELERRILKQDADLRAPARTERPVGRAAPAVLGGRRLSIAAAAFVLVVGALLSLGLIYALGGGSKPIIVKPNSLVAIDPRANRIVDVAPVGHAPRGVTVTARAVWVANSADGTVSELDVKTLKPIQTIGIGAQATELAAAGGAVWVATGFDDTLVKIDARTGGVLGKLSFRHAVDAAAYAVATGDGAVWAISSDELVKLNPSTNAILAGHRRLDCCNGLRDVAVGEGAVWTAATAEVVVRVSPRTAKSTGVLNLGVIPTALTAAYGSVWAASSGFNSTRLTVWRIDPQTLRVVQTISIGKEDSFLATVDIAAGAGAIWATNYDAGNLVRIDPASGEVVARIHIGRHPRGIAVGAHRVWVAVD
jgi:DNA-binding SARP family transcriptional activator/DNA-binding beta-propeller fold protein YncE